MKSVVNPLPKPFAPEFGTQGALRQPFGAHGRAHLDRWLPFLFVNRAGEPSTSIARRVAVNGPAYLVWSPADDEDAGRALEAIAKALRTRFGSILIIDVEEGPWRPVPADSQRLPHFQFRVATSETELARVAGEALAVALGKIELDLRRPEVELLEWKGPAAQIETDRVKIIIPPVHRAGEASFYPQLTHELAAACGDALLQAAFAYMESGKAGAPEHYRALGRSAFLAAAPPVSLWHRRAGPSRLDHKGGATPP